MTSEGWEFWRVTRATDGALEWLAATRPGGHGAVGRQKVWTLIPHLRAFIANWYVTQDHWSEDDETVWVHEQIDVVEARAVALEVPAPSAADVVRLTRPEACLTLDQIDRHTAEKVLGKRAAAALTARH